MKETIAIIAAFLALVGNISYLKDVIRKKVHPHPYTWFVWSIVSMTTFFGGLAKGAGIGALPTGIAEGFTILIFIFSLRSLWDHTSGHIRKIDTLFLIMCLIGLIPWALTKDPTLSVVTVVIVDIVAFIPTLRKTWMNPETEQPLLYEMNVSRHILTLFSLGTYNVATTLHSVAMICTNTIMTLFIRRKNIPTLKKVPVIIIAIASLIFSRLIFFFINDPEGPNLLIVVAMAFVIFIVSLYFYLRRFLL